MTTPPALGSSSTVRAVAWAGLTQVIGKGVAVVATLVLARLLVPADFGLFAVGLLVINYLDRVKDVGVGSALVYRREDWSRMAATGLPLSILSTAVLAVLAFSAAPLAAHFFHEPRAADLVRVLAVALLVSGLAIVPESRLRRAMDFRRRFVPETTAAAVKGGVSIGLAVSGLGVWSLVWGQVAGTVVLCVLYWLLSGWRPTIGWRADDARTLLRYGTPLVGVAVFAVVLENLDYLIIGHRMEAADLGYYVLAFRMPELVVIGFCVVTGQVLFPLFSRLQDDLGALGATYVRAVGYISLVTVPAGLMFALLADEVVLVLYGPTWEPAIPVLRLLGVFSLLYAVSFHSGEVFKAIGRPGILNSFAALELGMLAPALWLAAGHSITAVAAALVLVNVVLMLLKFAVVTKVLDLAPARLPRAFLPAALASATMSVALLLLDGVVGHLAPALRLVLLVVVGGITYVGSLSIVAPEVLRQLMSYARGRVSADTLVRG
jgi:lipopolysaccharide exporter